MKSPDPNEPSELPPTEERRKSRSKLTLRSIFRRIEGIDPKIKYTLAIGGGTLAVAIATIGGLSKLIDNDSKPVSIGNSSTPTPATSPLVNLPLPEPPKWLKSPVPVLVNPSTLPLQNTATQPPNQLTDSSRLQAIVDRVVKQIDPKKFPLEKLSIAIVDPATGEKAGYHADLRQIPASTVKLFWAVALYHNIERGTWQNAASFDPLAKKMLVESDNEAASFILDSLTLAPSGPDLLPDKFKEWQQRRQKINTFFNGLGYLNINVSQKTFPIPYLKFTEPTGNDRQLRLDRATEQAPNRNHFTAMQAAMLMNDTCATKRLISIASNDKICNWIKRDLQDPKWPKAPVIPGDDFNPIRAYLGEGIAKEKAKISAFFSKAGWTKGTRHEIAFVETSQGKKYVLAVFAGDEKYAVNGEIFPKISRYIHQEITK